MDQNLMRYLIIVFAATYTFNLVQYLGGGFENELMLSLLPLQMLIPGVIAAVFIRKEKGSFKEYGFKLGRLRYYLAAYVVMVGLHLFQSLLGAGLGLGRLMPITEGYARMQGVEAPPAAMIFLMVFILAPFTNLLLGLGEEFGWRGYIVNKFLPKGLFNAILLIGIIHAAWHFPVILMGHNFPDNPYLGCLIFTISMIPLGAIFIWLRLISGSAVVAGFAHGVFNGTVFLGGAFYPEAAMLFTNPVGLLGIPLLAIVAYLLFRFWPPKPG